MEHLIAIDPGTLNRTGVAVFGGGDLRAAFLEDEANPRTLNDWVTWWQNEDAECVCEFPVIYPGGRGKGDGNDLLQVARVAGRMTAGFAPSQITYVAPRTWKGNVPKAIMGQRILSKLTPEELKVLPKLSKALLHNVIDAVGIGLYALRRL
jgi:hypothetical protein